MDTKYSPHQLPEDELHQEKLSEFAELLADLRQLEYHDHPSEDILRAYVANRLLDDPQAGRVGATFRDEQAFEKFLRGRIPRWTRSDVAMHVLTCSVCQQYVMRLRASRWHLLGFAHQRSKEERNWLRRFALGALASAATAAIIAALWLWPASPPTTCWIEDPCWQTEVIRSPMKGSLIMVYHTSRGRF